MNIRKLPYQFDARDKVIRALMKVKVALMVMATGLGKTIVSALVVKKMDQFPGIFLVHDNELLDKAMKDYRKVLGESLRFGVYNGHRKDIEGADIVFASFQTMQRNLRRFGHRQFKWMIVDEGHHSHARTFRKVIEYFWCKKLAMTATPDRMDMQDIRDIFGSEVVDLPLEQAIARGLLPPIEYHVVTDKGFDEQALARLTRRVIDKGERISMKELNSRIFIKARDKRIGSIISRHGSKAVVFCRNIYHTKNLKRFLPNARTFHSDNSRSTNQATLRGFSSGEVQYLLAVNAFNEGHHLPDTDLVVFKRATSSLTIFYQQLGRGLHPGQKKLTVLDFVGSAQRILEVKELAERIAKLEKKFKPRKKSDRGYKKGRFHISGKGFNFVFANKVIRILDVVERLNVEFYPTWQEASEAAIRLKITSKEAYRKKYVSDPRLPSSPIYTYKDFPGWTVFLGGIKKKFYTYTQASRRVRKMSICTQLQYRVRRKEDDRLPSEPHEIYKKEWKGWSQFLGQRPRNNFYRTWQIAGRKATEAGVINQPTYLLRCGEDYRLPRDPATVYKNFPGWPIFLGRRNRRFKENPYKNWRRAAREAKKLGANSCKTYVRVIKLDPRLYADPLRVYKDCPDWDTFFGRQKKYKFYRTCKSATLAVQRLRIKSKKEYKEKRKQDTKLPVHPDLFYSNFPGWTKFLGKHKK